MLTLRGTGVVEGFTLRRGLGTAGGGIAVIGSLDAVIRNNIIEDNIAESPGFGSGGGVYTHWDTEGILLESNIIRNNGSGENGGGVHVRGGYVRVNELRNNVIADNTSYLGGGGVSISTVQARLLSNVISNNSTITAGGGIYVDLDGGGEIRGNTIVGNVIGYPGEGAGIETAGSPLISHNIIAVNVSGAGVNCAGAVARPTLECNDVWGNGNDSIAGCGTTGAGNFSADPLFCNEEGADYTLDRRSPCLPEQNPTCGFVGALPAACGDVAVEQRTWGDVKAWYR